LRELMMGHPSSGAWELHSGDGPMTARRRILVRNVLLLVLLSGNLYFLWEGSVRLLAPRQARMEMLGRESLAVKDLVLGHRLRPGPWQ